MSKSKKIWLGVFTFLPLIFLIIYVVVFFSFFLNGVDSTYPQEGTSPNFFAGSYVLLFVIIVLMAIVSLGLLIYYIVHANSNPKFDSNQKLIWILILLFASGVGSMIYYFMEIVPLKDPKEV